MASIFPAVQACGSSPSRLPHQGEGVGLADENRFSPKLDSHLPLDGGGREGVTASALLKKSLLPLLLALTFATPTLAIDPPYQRQMERLAEIMGSLYYLQPLCKTGSEDWREQMSELIALDEPNEDRRQRLAGSFNTGYTGFARLHRNCTPASREALSRLMSEAQQLARSIHTRFAE
jgi:uncharacterized protein (TIGR02301 family)